MRNLIMAFIFAIFSVETFALDKGHTFDYAEYNVFVKKNNFTYGQRFHDNLDYTQNIFRWDLNKKYRVEHRYIQKGEREEFWFRGQINNYNNGVLFYNSRLEYRSRQGKENIWRYRPQTGLKYDGYFLILEPQFTIGDGFQFNQWFIGREFKFRKVSISPQLQLESNDRHKVTKAFFTLDIKFKL